MGEGTGNDQVKVLIWSSAGHSEKTILEQSQLDSWGNAGRGNSKCKGPEVRTGGDFHGERLARKFTETAV